MNLIYPVVFTETEDDNSTVLVYIPDFDGSTEGYGINDAFSMAKDYIGNALYDKSDYPVSKPLKSINIKDTPFFIENKTFVAFVELNIDEFRIMQKSKNVRRNITLPEWLDVMATKAKINVSAVAQEALREKLCVN